MSRGGRKAARRLVSAGWVAELIGGGHPETYPGRGYVLVHVGYEGLEVYKAAHVPGAVYLDTLQIESSEDWNRRPREVVRAVCASLGIRSDTTVVLYGRDTESGEGHSGKYTGQLAAFRAAAIFIDAGATDVRVMDGGFAAWEWVVESGWVAPRAVADLEEAGDTPRVFVDLEEVREILEDPGWVLVDVRSWEEYAGEASGYEYIEAKGHIPGAVWGGDWDRDRKAVFYCGTGWRASEGWFRGWVMGWDAVVFDGGWLEWTGGGAG